ncbi:hypothetical protein EZN00_02635 [Clostridium tyrobutyricum]|jgi:hypothetical protein|nr:hypothetical protein EZN00_02635 [Clostridium tyrobutyricum]
MEIFGTQYMNLSKIIIDFNLYNCSYRVVSIKEMRQDYYYEKDK